jgi:hypothetical protein
MDMPFDPITESPIERRLNNSIARMSNFRNDDESLNTESEKLALRSSLLLPSTYHFIFYNSQ